MDYDELREVGKIWILMAVFSTCFFASCGQSQTGPTESATPVAHTKPGSPDMESRSVSTHNEYSAGDSYSEELEGSGFGSSDFDDRGRIRENQAEKYPEDIPRPR